MKCWKHFVRVQNLLRDFNTSLVRLRVAHIVCFHTFLYRKVYDPLLKLISHTIYDLRCLLRTNSGKIQTTKRGSKNSANFSYVWNVCRKQLARWVFLKPHLKLSSNIYLKLWQSRHITFSVAKEVHGEFLTYSKSGKTEFTSRSERLVQKSYKGKTVLLVI